MTGANDLALAMQFVGDRDLSQAPSYVKDRMERFDDAAVRLDAADRAAMGGTV